MCLCIIQVDMFRQTYSCVYHSYLEIHFNRNYHKQLENLFYDKKNYLYVK